MFPPFFFNCLFTFCGVRDAKVKTLSTGVIDLFVPCQVGRTKKQGAIQLPKFNQSPLVHTVTVAPSGPCQRSSASHYDELFNDGTSDQQPTTTLTVWLESNIKIFPKKKALDCNARCDYCPLVIVRAEKNGNDATQTPVKLVKKRVKLFDWLTMTERLTPFFRPFVFELALVCTTDTHRFSRPH